MIPPYFLGVLEGKQGAGASTDSALSLYLESVRRDAGFYPGAKAAAGVWKTRSAPAS